MASDHCDAVGNAGDPNCATAPKALPLSPNQFVPGLHTLARTIKGLVDGHTYYVVGADASAFTIELSETLGGPPIDLDATGAGIPASSTHSFGIVSVDLVAGTGRQSLYANLFPPVIDVPVTLHRLFAADGSTLAESTSLAGDGQSKSWAEGGRGGGISVTAPTASTKASPIVRAFGSGVMTAGVDIDIAAVSGLDLASRGLAAGGGVIEVGTSDAETIVESGVASAPEVPTTAGVRGGAVLRASRDVLIAARSDQKIRSESTSDGGGGVTFKSANSTAKTQFATTVDIGAGATLDAGRHMRLTADSKADGSTYSRSWSLAVAGGGRSDMENSDPGVRITSLTQTIVRGGARLTARTVDIVALVSKLVAKAEAFAEGYSAILVTEAEAYAKANVDIDSDTQVLILGDAAQPTTITGVEGVDLVARHEGTSIVRTAKRLAIAVVFPQGSFATGFDSFQNKVDASDDVQIVAGSRVASPTTESGLRDTDHSVALFVESINIPEDRATVVDFTARITDDDHDGTFDHYESNGDRGGVVNWDADVTILGGGGGAASPWSTTRAMSSWRTTSTSTVRSRRSARASGAITP